MAEYLYKATTLSGQTVEGSMEGKDEATIVQSLHQLGYIPIRILSPQAKGTGFRLPSILPQRVGIKHLFAFNQELSTIISAGLPLDRSLNILETLTENQRLKQALRDVVKRIEGGNSLSEALGNYPKIFPRLYVNLLRAGDSTLKESFQTSYSISSWAAIVPAIGELRSFPTTQCRRATRTARIALRLRFMRLR